MTEHIRKTDRRIVRTRQLLREALMQLIVERGYDAITIQDITDRANVARTTFYLHFTDKDDLLFQTMRDLYEELFASALMPSIEQVHEGHFGGDATDFTHVQQHADFYRIMFSEKGSAAFMARVRRYLAQFIQERLLEPLLPPGTQPRIPLEIVAHFTTGAQLGLLAWWVEQDMPYSAEKMARMMEDLCAQGSIWALGLRPDPAQT